MDSSLRSHSFFVMLFYKKMDDPDLHWRYTVQIGNRPIHFYFSSLKYSAMSSILQSRILQSSFNVCVLRFSFFRSLSNCLVLI